MHMAGLVCLRFELSKPSSVEDEHRAAVETNKLHGAIYLGCLLGLAVLTLSF